MSRPVDGIIFAEYSHLTISDVLAQSSKPRAFVHRLFGSPIRNSVVPDDYYGAGLATAHLIGLGHSRIAYVNGPENWHTCRARLSGYKDALAAHNLPFDASLIQPGDWEIESGYAAAKNLLQLAERPTAIFAANDAMALGAIYAIQDAGLNVPNDVAVVGYTTAILQTRTASDHNGQYACDTLQKVKLTAIPYFAWGNRGLKSIRVWIPHL